MPLNKFYKEVRKMKKMLKMVSGLLIAALLVIGLCATVFADDENPSPIGQIATSDNPYFYAYGDAADETMTEGIFRTDIGRSDGTVYIYNWEMGTTDGSPATVTFTPAGAPQEGQQLFLYKWENGGWNLLMGPVEGTSLTYTFEHWCPVALVVYVPNAAPGPQPTPTPTPTPTPSPKTGETDYLLFAALAALLIGGVVAGVVVRKNKA
jgi:LPXTG-motif cell wall-anchored protein